MKPQKLIMCGFGSYGKETVIDFKKADHGLFLISGDTGSGKTTIFDGITFALYGETSGGKRDGKMMRSQYASADTETYVELTFSYRNEVYTVRRTPEYMREKKRGSGLVKAAATVELTMPDGTVFRGKMKETDKKICEIMGIDREQFTQIAMIAQGDFLRLLHAKSEDRKKIFSTIFHTGIYWQVEMELAERRKALKEKISGTEERIRAYVRGIRVPRSDDNPIEDEMVEKLDLSKISTVLQRVQEEDRKSIARLQTEIDETEKLYRDILEKRTAAKADNDLLDACLHAKKTLETKEEQSSAYLIQKEKLVWAEKAYGIKVFEEQMQIAEQRKKQALESLKLLEAEKVFAWGEVKQMQEVFCLRYEDVCSEGKWNIMDVHMENAAWTQVITEWKAEDVRLTAIGRLKAELDKKRRQIGLIIKDYEGKKETLKTELQYMKYAAEKYMELQERFLCEQAGILANERLKPGEPCPVCGSREHPSPAALSDNAVTENQVQQAQREWEKRRCICESMSLEIKTQEVRAEEMLTQLHEEEKQIPIELEERQKLLVKMIRAAEKTQEIFAESRRKKEEADRCKISAEETKKRFEQERRDAGFAADTEYEEFISMWKNRGELERSKRENEKFFAALTEIKASVRTFEAQTAGKKYTDLSEMEKLMSQRDQEYKLLQKEKEDILSRVNANDSIQKNLKEEETVFSHLQEQFLIYDELWQVASGKVKGQVRMGFETYVQRMYFEKILMAANRRFMTFTNGKMKLKSRPLEETGLVGSAGLDLNVYMMTTGKERDIKTLSGGESFLASLALALGLSDVVQSQAGAVRLESMFVDEGFGALDEGTREQAVRVLNDLAGDDRLVGIISHVDALKDRIERKLVVARDHEGSRVTWNF